MGGRTRSLFGFLVVLVVGAQLLHTEPIYAATDGGSGMTCSFFGFVLRPFGYCTEPSQEYNPRVEERSFNVQTILDRGLVAGEATSTRPSQLVAAASIGLSSTDARVIAESVYNENLRTIQEQNALMVALSMIADRKAFQSLYDQMSSDLSSVRESLTRTIANAREDAQRSGGGGGTVDLSVGGTLSSPTLTGTISLSGLPVNALLFTNSSGAMTAVSGLNVDDSGNLLIGTTTAQEQLTVATPIYLADATPSTTANRLYSIAGSLYWNGSIIAASSSANWSASAGNVYRPTGSVGIGTSSPAAELAVVGDIALTGGIYDSGYSLGTSGMVLQSSGTGVDWVATSTLGLGVDLSGSSIEDLSDVAAMTENFGDLLYWNGSAWSDIATSALAINTDDVIEGTNQFYTNARVASYISGSSTILKNNTEAALEGYLAGVTNVFTNNDVIGDANIADTITASNYLLLTDWYATTTDGLSEGASNLYFTNARSDARFNLNFNATTTDALSEGATNLYYTLPRFAAALSGTTTDALSEGSSNLYFTNARFDARFNLNFNGTTTDALTEGGTNLYYTDARVASYINGSTSISKLGQFIDESELNIVAAPVDGYVLQASSTAAGGFVWQATSSLGITGGGGGASAFTDLIDTPGSYTTGDIFYAASSTAIVRLAAGGDGTVLKISGGVPSWGADIGGSGGGGVWATTSNNLAIYPSDPNDIVVIGGSATTTTGYDLEVIGSALIPTLTSNTMTATTGSILGNLAVDGNFNLGADAVNNANRIFNLEEDVSNTNNFFSVYNNPRLTATISGSRSGYASYNLFEADAIVEGANSYEAVALYGEVQVDGSSSVSTSRAGQFIVDYNSTTGTGDNAYTLSSNLSVALGATINTGYGYFSDLEVVGTVNNYYGIFLQDLVEGTMTNSYAFWANESDMVLDGDGNGSPGGTDGGSELFFGEGQDAAIWYDGTNFNIDPQIVGSGAVVIPNGSLGIGSSTPTAELTVAGDIAVTGGIYDSNTDLGSAGQLLSSTGASVDWISTSTLGLTTDDIAEASNLYFTNARSDARFNLNFNATTTDALTEGASNLYYTDARVATYISGSSTILKNNTEAALESYLSGVTNVFTNNDTIGVANGGTGLTSYVTGDIIYATGAATLSALGAGGEGTVLKISGGVPSWGTDISGGGGGSGLWATTTDGLAIYPANVTDVVVVGASATTTSGFQFEVVGDTLVDGIRADRATVTDFIINSERFTDLTGDGLRRVSNALAVNCADLQGTGIQCASDNFAIDFTEFDTDSITEGSTNFWGKWGEGFGTLYYAPGSERVGIGDTDADYTLELAGSINNGYFGVSSNASGDGDIFEIDSGGNVGIGTNAPGELLHISGGNLLLDNTQSIRWENNAASENTIMAYDSSNNLQIGSGIGNNLQLYGANNQIFFIGGGEVARIDSTGDFGIDDTTPDYKLEVVGTSTNGYFGITNLTDGDIFEIDGSGNVGIGTATPSRTLSVAGDIYATGALYDSTGSAGVNGYVLVSTSTGLVWSATNTLGLPAGSVTSVAASVPTGWTITGSPITSAGTLTFDYDTGYGAVLTASTSEWNTFYQTPSSRITAGTGLSWAGNTLNAEVQSSDLSNYFLLSDWYATTTDGLAEGGTNLYFTNARSDARFNLNFNGTTTDALAQGVSNLYYATSLFAADLNSTTTDALSEGASNFYYTDARVALYINGSSSITRLGQTINANELASEDFGDFTCNGTTCSFDNSTVASSTLAGNAWTAGYVLQASSTATGGLAWVATTSLGFSGQTLNLGADNQIPFTNAGGTDFEYSSTFVFDGTSLGVGTSTLARILSIADTNNPGIRITDSTNNVALDMRAEDFQGFIGTFSNNDLRLVTNNSSRMTIDTNGDVGIGTTSPASRLDVWGDVGISTTSLFALDIKDASQNRTLFVNTTDQKVGIATSTASGALTIDGNGLAAAGVAGIDSYYTLANTASGSVQYGNRMYVNASGNTATTTLVGSVIRLEDSTSFGNTTRGLEVQVNAGSNTSGESTALSGFARTFGVRGYTSADAGGRFEPAGGFFETGGTAQGNALRAFSSTITSSDLVTLFQDTSDFTGTGLLMSFGNTGGTFSSSSSKFVDFQESGSSKFTVTAQGTTTIGDGTTNNQAGLQIGFGGICVDNDGTCTASTTGRISSVSSSMGNSDLAELYFSSDNLEPGELVMADGFISIERARKGNIKPMLGVVSTKPGIVLGANDSSLIPGQRAYPLALTGRVPVKLSDENGPINIGDPLTLSSIPGVAMKATGAAEIVGYALESFDGTRAYTSGYINQFGDDIAAPNSNPLSTNTDTRINDGCTFGAGGATGSGEEVCTTTPGTNTDDTTNTDAQDAAYEAQKAALAALRYKSAETIALNSDETVRVGRVTMFVDRGYLQTVEQSDILNELSGTDPELLPNAIDEDDTLWSRIKELAFNFVDGVLTVAGLQTTELYAQKIETESIVTEELCVGGTCITEAELKALLESRDQNSTTGNTDDEESDPVVTNPGDTNESDEDTTEPTDEVETSSSTATTTETNNPGNETHSTTTPPSTATDTTTASDETTTESEAPDTEAPLEDNLETDESTEETVGEEEQVVDEEETENEEAAPVASESHEEA